MKVGLIDVDGHNFPNLPLMKISAYHKAKGDEVLRYNPFEGEHDIVYMSKVFDFTRDYDAPIYADQIIKGGTGYGDLKTVLPDVIEHCYPDYDFYDIKNTAYGFLTRGCPRNCEFCIVSYKEGRISHQVADLSEFWKSQKHIKLLDPNILACKDSNKLLEQLIDSKAYIDFTQGLDIRFVDDYTISRLRSMRIKMIHFAWDNPEEDLLGRFEYFKNNTNLNERKLRVYVLTNYNSTHDQDLYRIYRLREMGYDPFVMIYAKDKAPRQTRKLQRWVNNKWIFRACERFEDYMAVARR